MSFQECFKEFTDCNLPPIIYVDTSFIVESLIKGQRHQEVAMDFIDALAKAKDQPIVIFSELLKSEMRCAVISICLRNEFGGRVKIGDRLFENPDYIKKYYVKAEAAEVKLYEIMQRFKHWTSVPIDEKITQRAGKIMPKYRLGSLDAIHIATMEEWGINDIVVFDWGIEELPRYRANINIWTVNGWARHQKRLKKRSTIVKKGKGNK